MAGYIIYSLDWDKFQRFVAHPTQSQLDSIGRLLLDVFEEDDYKADPNDVILSCPRESGALSRMAAERLVRPDWYGDLSRRGKEVWERVLFLLGTDRGGVDLGFRCDSDGVYWDVMELAWKRLKVVPGRVSDVALSAFGERPYRYNPQLGEAKTREQHDEEVKVPLSSRFAVLGSLLRLFKEGLVSGATEGGFDGWKPMHSMHTPDEVQKMLAELRSVESAMQNGDEDVREQYEEELMPAMEAIARDGRMLFVQVDT